MTDAEILLLIIILVSLAFLFYLIGFRLGYKRALIEVTNRIKKSSSYLNEIFKEFQEQMRLASKIGRALEENDGKIPTREIYDFIYDNHLTEEGKIYCPCEDPEHCDVFRLLREFRSSHKNLFTEEELERDDGL